MRISPKLRSLDDPATTSHTTHRSVGGWIVLKNVGTLPSRWPFMNSNTATTQTTPPPTPTQTMTTATMVAMMMAMMATTATASRFHSAICLTQISSLVLHVYPQTSNQQRPSHSAPYAPTPPHSS